MINCQLVETNRSSFLQRMHIIIIIIIIQLSSFKIYSITKKMKKSAINKINKALEFVQRIFVNFTATLFVVYVLEILS